MSGRLKKAEISGMFPYPRVGRSGTEDQEISGKSYLNIYPFSTILSVLQVSLQIVFVDICTNMHKKVCSL